MRALRTFLLLLLALIVGFVLAWWIFCRGKKTVTIMETDYLVADSGYTTQAAIGGSVITWRRQDPGIDRFSVTIPDGLCPNTPPFYENNGKGTMTATASGNEIIKCTVRDQPAGSLSTYPFNLTTNLNKRRQTSPVPTPQILKEEKQGGDGKPPTPAAIPDSIPGSCEGCGSATGQVGLDNAPLAPGVPVETPDALHATTPPQTQLPYYITCTMDPKSQKYQASVAPIVVPSTRSVNQWAVSGQIPIGGWYVEFPPDKTPCSNGLKFVGNETCNLDSSAALNTPYNYTAHLSQCPFGGSSSDAPGIFTITPPPPGGQQ